MSQTSEFEGRVYGKGERLLMWRRFRKRRNCEKWLERVGGISQQLIEIKGGE